MEESRIKEEGMKEKRSFRWRWPLAAALVVVFLAVAANSKIGFFFNGSNSLHQEFNKQKVSQKHENLKVPIPMWLSRKSPPTSYSVKFESFTTMMNLVKDGYYESRPFTAGGYNWTFLIYPKGIEKNNYVSLYGRIDKSSIIGDRQDVYVEIKFFVYQRSTSLYYYYQVNEPVMFHPFKPEWGVASFLETFRFETSGYGYVSKGGECEFGIDVFVAPPFNQWENFTYDQNFSDSHQESGKHKVSQKHENLKAPVPIGLWRERPPTSYSVKFESFKTMMDLVKDGYYESRPFTVGGYNWTFLIYPTGIEKNRFVSLYARIDNSSLIGDPQDVYAEITFFVYHPFSRLYYYYQEKEPVMFRPFKPEWGVENFLATSLFEISGLYGYMSVGGECELGIDVFLAPPFNQWENFTYDENISNPIFNWNLTDFSTLYLDSYTSETFSSGGRNWVLKVYPNGDGVGTGDSLSLYLLSEPNENDYVRAKLRVLNQIISSNNVEKQVEGWPNAAENGWGFEQFISISDLKDGTKGFVVEDLLEVEVEIMAFSKTKHSI